MIAKLRQNLLPIPPADYRILDKRYDIEKLRMIIREKSLVPIISRKSNSTIGNNDMD